MSAMSEDHEVTSGFCPWSVKPTTMQELIDTTTQLAAWEMAHIRSAPDEWKPIVTSELMTEICKELVALKQPPVSTPRDIGDVGAHARDVAAGARPNRKLDSFHFFDTFGDALSHFSQVWTVVSVEASTDKITDTFEFNGSTITMPVHAVPRWTVTICNHRDDDAEYKKFVFGIGTMVEVSSYLTPSPQNVLRIPPTDDHYNDIGE